MLGRPYPLAAELHHVVGALADRVIEGPAADPLAGFEKADVESPRGKLVRRLKTRQAGAHDDDIAVEFGRARHRRQPTHPSVRRSLRIRSRP